MINTLASRLDWRLDEVQELKQSNPEVYYTAFMFRYGVLENIRETANEVLRDYGGWKCNHEHDCCGCWALIGMDVAQIGEDAFILVENWRQNV